MGQRLGQLPHCLLLWAELTLIRVLGAAVGADRPSCRLIPQAGPAPQGSGLRQQQPQPAQQGSPEIKTLREKSHTGLSWFEPDFSVTLNAPHFL